MKNVLLSYKKSIIEVGLLLLYALTIFNYVFTGIKFKVWDQVFFDNVYLMRRVLIIVLIGCFFSTVLSKIKNKKLILLSILVFAYIILISWNSEIVNKRDFANIYLGTLVYYLLVISLKDIKYNKIIKITFVILCSYSFTILIMVFLGILDNSLVFRGIHEAHRYLLGYNWTTDTAYTFLYIVMYYIYIRKKNVRTFELALIIVLNTLVYYLTNVRSVLLISIILIIACCVLKYYKAIYKYKFNYFLILSIFIICTTVGIVLLSYFYDPDIAWMSTLNKLLSNRLLLGYNSISENGISLFGNYIEYTMGNGYNVVDSSFLRILLDYGIVSYILFVVMLLYFSYLMAAKKDVYMILIFAISLLHMMINIDFFYLKFNFLFFIPSYYKYKTYELVL